ncbi:MAG: DUF555 domain-containing protein [Methanocalculaceae archaeon]|jgi:uncharacterized protein (UPF0212 family)|nr:DUF555 domain-containing protein [Methanocalculaceae archaeon]
MPDYHVTLEAAWTVKDVATIQDAISISVNEAGKRLHTSAKFVNIDVMVIPCPYCDEEINSALIIARTGIVGLLLSMKVFNAECDEHAERIAKSVIGRAIRDIPLATYDITICETGEERK